MIFITFDSKAQFFVLNNKFKQSSMPTFTVTGHSEDYASFATIK